MWIEFIVIIFISFGISIFLVWKIPPLERKIHVPENQKSEQMVRIHYGYGCVTSIVIVPVNEITDYIRKFTILSIEPYNKPKK